MEERNIDFDIPVTRDQWKQIAETAHGMEPSGYGWNGDDPERIRVFLRDEEARGLWSRFVSDEGQYGAHDLEIAQIEYNGGRPFAHLEALPTAVEPAISDGEQAAMEVGQERFVREKWHQLMERSGLHFTPGTIPTDMR